MVVLPQRNCLLIWVPLKLRLWDLLFQGFSKRNLGRPVPSWLSQERSVLRVQHALECCGDFITMFEHSERRLVLFRRAEKVKSLRSCLWVRVRNLSLQLLKFESLFLLLILASWPLPLRLCILLFVVFWLRQWKASSSYPAVHFFGYRWVHPHPATR